MRDEEWRVALGDGSAGGGAVSASENVVANKPAEGSAGVAVGDVHRRNCARGGFGSSNRGGNRKCLARLVRIGGGAHSLVFPAVFKRLDFAGVSITFGSIPIQLT